MGKFAKAAVLAFAAFNLAATNGASPITNTPVVTPDQDQEEGFNQPDEPPPAEEMPPSETPEGQEPEYASPEDIAPEPEHVKEIKPQPAQKKATSSAEDEPMPLIRRKREAVEYNVKPLPKKIRHPNAEKGLIRISREKVYYYKVKTSDQTKASSIHIGFISLEKLKNPDSGAYFTDYYTANSNPAVLYDYEWQLFRKFSKLGVKLGTGLAVATGNGQFRDPSLQGGLTPKEKFNFVIIPNSAGVVFRLHLWEKQPIIPYAEGGGLLIAFSELRSDSKSPKFGGALGAYAAAGAAVNISSLEAVSMLELDRDYSINNIYLFGEYRYIAGFGHFDFSTDMINGGVTVEF